jgi:hypothetical protein
MNVSTADDFRRQAEECRQMAARAISPIDKASWLRLAEDWLRLAQTADKSAARASKERK